MKSPVIFLAIVGCLVNASAALSSQNRTLLQSLDDMLLEATFANGHRQVLAAKLSPTCEKAALSSLISAAVDTDAMTCDTFTEVIQDIGAVLLQTVTSASSLIVDLNTILNGVPLCLSTYSWFNFLQIIPCLFSQFKEIWTAVSDFWNFSDYVGEPLAVAQELFSCLANRQSTAVVLVQRIVSDAKQCN